jgi:glycosyltransferase involved in cell wall biosynthesis
MEQLSVVIIAYNEEKNIGPCIESVRLIADEIIVLDSLSSDNTAAIAASAGAKVFREEFRGYVAQKNRAVQLAAHRYILSIDADERLDAILLASIAEAKKTFQYRAYRMNRCNNYAGKFIRHGTWYPDRKIRLFDKTIATWGGFDPHDKIIFNKPVAVKQLKGEILHFSFVSKEQHKIKNEKLSSIAAISLYQSGRKTRWFNLLINPAWAFIHDYVVRLGFLNGPQSFHISKSQAVYTYLKHKKLYQYQKSKLD